MKQFDEDHFQLVSRVNAIHEAEQAGDAIALAHELGEFNASRRALQSEEVELIAVNYPRFSAHAKHHAETLIALDRLSETLRPENPLKEWLSSASTS